MSEGSDHAAILIAVSYQALQRAIREDQNTILADCTVLILFAGFYVEATLNHILESINSDIRSFPMSVTISRGKNNIGLQDKLAWFYNEFVEEHKFSYWNDLRGSSIQSKLGELFPGFQELLSFRNDIAHGVISDIARSLDKSEQLRQQAKDIARKLYEISEINGYKVPRLISYQDAIRSMTNNSLDISIHSSS